MLVLYILTVLLILKDCQCNNTTNQCPNIKASLGHAIRKRRHVNFPDGSNFVVTVSAVKTFMTHVPSGWNLVVDLNLEFPLPDSKTMNAHWRKKLHHRQKRDFWERLQSSIDYHNLNGRACVLRTICEAKNNLAPPGKSLVHDVLRAIFMAPLHEEDFADEMVNSYREILEPNFCNKVNDCPFSLLHFMLALNKQKTYGNYV